MDDETLYVTLENEDQTQVTVESDEESSVVLDRENATVVTLDGNNINITVDEQDAAVSLEELTTEITFQEALLLQTGSTADASNILTYTAGEALGGHRAVVIEDAEAYYADNTVIANASRVAGITTGAAAQGNATTIKTYGEISEPSWNWSLDTPIFLGTNGMLVQSAPSSGFSLIVGYPITSTKLFIDLQLSLFLL